MSQFSVSERLFSLSGKHDLELNADAINSIKNESHKEIHPLRTIVEMVCSLFGLKFEAASRDLYTLTHSKSGYECRVAMQSFNAQLNKDASGRVQCTETKGQDHSTYRYDLCIDNENPIYLGEIIESKCFFRASSSVPPSYDDRYSAIRFGIQDRFTSSSEAVNRIHTMMTKKWISEPELNDSLKYLKDTCHAQDVEFSVCEVNELIRYQVTLANGETILLREFDPNQPKSKRQYRRRHIGNDIDRRDYEKLYDLTEGRNNLK
ncbi:MAG: hypothetical protein HAW66_04990 [Shewanella sp.]|nr:hypothetical protein [Shewanella sp.]